jgi:hypothetical protein
VDKFSLAGLQCMQGGLSFSVYCSLSCIAFYLVRSQIQLLRNYTNLLLRT